MGKRYTVSASAATWSAPLISDSGQSFERKRRR
jgi:hypothetical protein